MRNLTIGLAAFATLLPGVAMAEVKHPRKLLAMTPEAFRSTVAVEDGMQAAETVISTQPAFSTRGPLFASVIEDSHLRAVVDRKTGATRYEVHQHIRYMGPRREYHLVNYAAPDGVRQVKPLLAKHGSDYCPDSDNVMACSMAKHVAFTVDEAVLATVAARYRPGSGEGLSFTLKDANERGDWHGGIVPAEAAGLLKAVADYRSKLSVASRNAPERAGI